VLMLLGETFGLLVLVALIVATVRWIDRSVE
jgi:hypothetical protein